MAFQVVMVATVNMVLPAVMRAVAVAMVVPVLAVAASCLWPIFGDLVQT